MPSTQKIIVLRFSAMGDVAMVASVLREFLAQNPNVELIIVSREAFKPFFEQIPGIIFHSIQPKTIHKGLKGLFKLFRELKSYHADAVADLHDNMRSRTLSAFFRLSGIPIKRIDKGRAEKKALTRSENKILKPLKPTVERYADVFRSLNFPLTLSHKLESFKKELPEQIGSWFEEGNQKRIGISPFAQHVYKMYALPKMTEVIQQLIQSGYTLYIFGGGSTEQKIAEEWTQLDPNIHNLIGKYSLTEELAIISNLDLMLSMDSSGMHMASLEGVPVISIWGPTHPFAGFLGYGQLMEDCIQIDHPARPNSIYGNKPCLCGVEQCIDLIEPKSIVHKIKEKLNG